MRRIRRVGLAWAVVGLDFCLAACHLVPQGGMAERCADLMRRADPGVDIDITRREAAATSLTTIVAHVEGNRTNLPSHPPITHHLAVECTYENGVLTGFRWTKGPK
jgi:hypothetical protein